MCDFETGNRNSMVKNLRHVHITKTTINKTKTTEEYKGVRGNTNIFAIFSFLLLVLSANYNIYNRYIRAAHSYAAFCTYPHEVEVF